MQFTSLVFIFYFLPLVLGVYYLVQKNLPARKLWLLLASAVFYFFWEPYFFFALAFSAVLNYFSARALRGPRCRLVYWLSIALNFALLFAVKYWDFALDTIFELSGTAVGLRLGVALPVGAGFLFLRAVSYLTDVRRGALLPSKDFLTTALYFCFFPLVILGPLMRFADFSAQLVSNEHSFRRFSIGLCRFAVGLGKKVLLASAFIDIYTRIFGLSSIGITVYSVPAALAWLGAITYLLAVYFDLSAYFDLSIGLCLMFGMKTGEEMDYPLSKGCITDFIGGFFRSLFAWFRDYLFEPLMARSKKNKDSVVRNRLITWILIGLFFSASWNKLLWAMGMMLLLTAEDFLSLSRLKRKPWYLHLYTLIALTLLFVVFGAPDLYQAGIYLSNLFAASYNGIWSPLVAMFLKEYCVYYALGILFATPFANRINALAFHQKLGKGGRVLTTLYPAAIVGIFILSIAKIAAGGVPEFMFLRF